MNQPGVIGPMITALGFRSWYWACRPAMLVAAPGGFWVAIQAALITGGMGGVVGGLGTAAGQKQGGKRVQRLVSASDEELRQLPGAVVYPVPELKSILCRRVVLGTNPDFIITTTDARSQKYGLASALAFDAVVEALRDCYGELVQTS